MFCPIRPAVPVSLPPTMNSVRGSVMPANVNCLASPMSADVSPPIPFSRKEAGAGCMLRPNSAAVAREIVL